MNIRICITSVFLVGTMILAGCNSDEKKASSRSGRHTKGTRILGPTEKVEEYLKLVFDPDTREKAYRFLTMETRNTIPLKTFKTLLYDELSSTFMFRDASDIRLRIDHKKDFPVTDDHYIIYSLLQISFPYADGFKDKFRLTKFHVFREDEGWSIEPFIHKETYTRRFVPSLIVGKQFELEEIRPQFYEIIGKDLLEERRKLREIEVKADEEAGSKEKAVEKIGDLVVPDLGVNKTQIAETEEEENTDTALSEDPASRRAVAFIVVGQLHFQTGNIPAAEVSFRKALELDKTNETAKDYLERCTDIRRFQAEKRKQIELYEKLLELDEKEKDLDTSSSDK